MSCEKGGTVPAAVAERPTVTIPETGKGYIDPIDISFGGGEPYRAAIERRVAEIRMYPRFSI